MSLFPILIHQSFAVESEVTLMLVRGEEGGNAINKLNRLIGPIIPEEKDPEAEENPEGDEANKEGDENPDAENPEGFQDIWNKLWRSYNLLFRRGYVTN